MAFRTCVLFVTALSLLERESHAQLNVCGQAPLNTRIVGGENAPPGNWPWQANLLQTFPTYEIMCGGSLINSKWVLTAAHCFSSTNTANWNVYLGRQELYGTNSNQQVRTLSSIVRHPLYNSDTHDNDLTLLELSTTVTFTDYIQPICLAASSSTFYNGTETWVTGWGNVKYNVALPSPGTLQEVQIPIVGNNMCNCLYGKGSITANMMCAGLLAGGKDSCQGDSGGPLVVKQGSAWIQAGIVSFGNECALPNYPGVYTRVSRYQAWINSIITTNQPGFVSYISSGTNSDNSTCSSSPSITVTPSTPTTTTTTAKPVVCGLAPLNNGGSSGLVAAGMWPWQVSLQMNGVQVCGGTLITQTYVMSAAQCFNSSQLNSNQWTVILGTSMSLAVSEITLSNQPGNNIAVLYLATSVTLTDNIQPLCLGLGNAVFPSGTQCWVTGWRSTQSGVPNIQQQNTTVVNCGSSASSSSICITAVTLQQGDAGDPLLCKQGNTWFQAAVIMTNTSSTSRATSSQIMTLTKVSQFTAFLQSTISNLPTSSAAASHISTIIPFVLPLLSLLTPL